MRLASLMKTAAMAALAAAMMTGALPANAAEDTQRGWSGGDREHRRQLGSQDRGNRATGARLQRQNRSVLREQRAERRNQVQARQADRSSEFRRIDGQNERSAALIERGVTPSLERPQARDLDRNRDRNNTGFRNRGDQFGVTYRTGNDWRDRDRNWGDRNRGWRNRDNDWRDRNDDRRNRDNDWRYDRDRNEPDWRDRNRNDGDWRDRDWRDRDNDRRYDWRRDDRGWRDRDRNGRDWRYDWRDHQGDNRRDYRPWDRDAWRNDWRYDWNRHRLDNRRLYSPGRYHAPYRDYSYRRLGIGFSIGRLFFGSRYLISDPPSYRLPPIYGPYRWVRYYDDVLLVDTNSGVVVDVIYDFFW